MEKLINKATAAAMLSISEATLNRIVLDGDLPMIKIRGSCRFTEKDIADYLETCRVQATVPQQSQRPSKRQKVEAHPCLYVPGMKVV